jgi:hypothetical protein
MGVAAFEGVVRKQAGLAGRNNSKNKAKSRKENKRREENSLPIQSQDKPNHINQSSRAKTGANSHMQESSPVIVSRSLISIHLCSFFHPVHTTCHQNHVSSAVFHVIKEGRSAEQNKPCTKEANAKSC